MSTSVLARIAERTRADLAARQAAAPLDLLRRRAERSPRDFAGALRGGTLSLIAEFKPRSPSRGAIRPNARPEEIAGVYDRYAAAISVLCDGPFFGGGYDLLARIRRATSLPLLAKDFVVDGYQVFEAREHGADAILLIVALLPEDALRELLGLARSLGMAALVETHDVHEIDVAVRVGSDVIGVNSRDLRTLGIDLPRARERLQRVPASCVRVAESGLDCRRDVDAVRDTADAVLIGSSLMAAPDPAARIEELGWESR